jgi:aminopeptidase N
VRDDLIVLDTDRVTLRFEGMPNRPVPSLFRQFSAPVKISSNLAQEDKLFLARHDSDPFNRWQALQDVAMEPDGRRRRRHALEDDKVDALARALEDTVTSEALDPAFKAHALALPAETQVARTHRQRMSTPTASTRCAGRWSPRSRHGSAVRSRRSTAPTQLRRAYSPDFRQAGQRSLRNAALGMLVLGNAAGRRARARAVRAAANMTDRFAALGAVVAAWTADAQALLGDFRTMYTADPLVFDKWLSLNAMAPDDGRRRPHARPARRPDIPENNPNRLRALVGTFGMNNPTQFARPDGEGFRFVTGFVADVDTRNPQVAARVLTAFRVWQSFEPKRREAAEKALKSLQESGNSAATRPIS